MDKDDLKNLKKRYLIWLYKTTKEAFDKIERKFTQLEVDKFILGELKKQDKAGKMKRFVDDFETYIQNKIKDGAALKYEGKNLKPEYQFLLAKLNAIEKAIIKESGKKALDETRLLYEVEMVDRILKSRDH